MYCNKDGPIDQEVEFKFQTWNGILKSDAQNAGFIKGLLKDDCHVLNVRGVK